MRHLHCTRLHAAVLGLIGIIFLFNLSSCGGSAVEPNRGTSTVTPIVVLTVGGGGHNGVDLGGLVNGSPADGGFVEHWPVNLKAQVFLPSGATVDNDPIVGENIHKAGKIHFEKSQDGGDTWVAFKSDVELNTSGIASFNNADAREGCPGDIFLLRAEFTPSQENNPKKSNGSSLTSAASDSFQEFRGESEQNPIVAAFITVPGDYDADSETLTHYSLDIGGGNTQVPGTSADRENGNVDVRPIGFTLHLVMAGQHDYHLVGKSHINNPDGDPSDVDFELPFSIDTCGSTDDYGNPLTETVAFDFTGTSPKGQGPLISHLFIKGSTWEVGDPHADKTQPIGTQPNQSPVAQLTGNWTSGTDVAWNATASSDPDGYLVRYDWDFDNNGSIDLFNGGPNQTHTYGFSGNVTARVVVTDNGGFTSAATYSVLIP